MLEQKERNDVKVRAKELNDTKWRRTHEVDKTNMTGDYSEVEMTLKDCKLRKHPNSQVIDEVRDEHVSDIRSRLTYVNTDYPDIHQLTVLCIIGHGLSEDMAEHVRKTGEWRWDMPDCEEENGIGKTEENVKKEAAKGDIVVFASGFLSPNWVVKRLREREVKGVESTVVIIIDSCYSGVWTRKISDSLRAKPLDHTRVIVQTACGENETSYGGIFWPSFQALQHDNGTSFPPENAPEPAAPEPPLQTPTFYNSYYPDESYAGSTTVELDLGGTEMRFFTDGRFFNKFCDEAFYASSRGVPDTDLEMFFKSFRNEGESEIRCYRLKRYVDIKKPEHERRDEPMALILVKWQENQYHLHLHFTDFPCRLENLESVSHVETRAANRPFGGPIPKYERKEVKGTKKSIKRSDPEDQEAWAYIKGSLLVDKSIEKVGQHTWDDETCWRMDNTEPPNVIRSRSAILQELTGYD